MLSKSVLLIGIVVLFIQEGSSDLTDDFLSATPIHPTFKIPEVIAQEGNQLKVEAVSNFNGTFNPFDECSVNRTDLVVGDYGVIKTPNYPRNYPARTTCQWYLESIPGTQIEATIFDLYTQPWFFTYFDYVMISKTGNFSQVDKMAGDMNLKTPLTITSKANQFGIRFKSGTIWNYRGMKVHYVVKPVNESLAKIAPSPFDNVCGLSNLLGSQYPPTTTTPQPETSPPTSTTAKTDDFIIGPGSASQGSFPWMAAMLIDGRSFCGGSLIDDQHVLTAAHCTDGARQITLMLGAINIKDKEEKGRQVINVTRESIYQHPDYNPHTISHDITVIKLPEKVNFSDNVRPICLPNRYHLTQKFVSEEVRVSGWGKTLDWAPGISPVLKNTTVHVISNGLCRTFFRSIVTGNLICIGTKFYASPCRGDSGGPLVVKQTNDAGQSYFMQVGIVSFGGNSCQRGYPVGFTRVTAFLDYISSVTGKTL